MKKSRLDVLKSFYSDAVNCNQWFNYGRTWANIPINLLALSSYVSVILLFLGLEKSVVLLLFLTSSIAIAIFLLGFFLFKRGGQGFDETMGLWRNPHIQMLRLVVWYNSALDGKKNNLPFPVELKSWGLTDWDDFILLCNYVLEKGKLAKAEPIIQNFFNKEKLKKRE